MKPTLLKTSLISAAALSAAALAPMAGAASTADYSASNLRVDTQAVNMVSDSWLDVADAYSRLQAGDTVQARSELAQAVAKLREAQRKDASLGVSFSGLTKPVKALHDELAGLKTRLNDPAAKQQLEAMLQSAGVI